MTGPSIAVIGGGIVGSWAALHLAEAGADTTLIEQFPLPHSRGSSHGLSRAFRFLGELEMGRLDYSLERWLALQEVCKRRMFVKTGLLNLGVHGDPELDRYASVLKNNGRAHEWLDSKAIRSRFSMFDYPDDWGAVSDPEGGILIAQRCLSAVQERLLAAGGSIVSARAAHVSEDPAAGVRIEMHSDRQDAGESLAFDRVVVCAGPWTGKLLPQLSQLLQALLIPVTYWHDPSDAYSVQNGCPIIFNARLTGIYGLPSWEYPGLVKILYHGGPETDPDTRDSVCAEDYVRRVQDYVRRYLPRLESAGPALRESCMYTMTPDSNPIIDRLSERLVVGCGFSGSGFKHSPATGQMLAAYALDQEDALPGTYGAHRYRLARFQPDALPH